MKIFPTLLLLTCLPLHGDELATKHLVLDLDAAKGVKVDEKQRVLCWTNQVEFAAKDFVPNDKGRKEAGSGIPTFLKAEGERKFPAVCFQRQELINNNEDAFDHLTQGGGHTWYAVIAVYDQKSAAKNTHAIFGNLRNTADADGGTGGNYEGFWGVIHDDRRVFAGLRNGVHFDRNSENNPELLSKSALEKNRYYVVAGRMEKADDKAKLEVFVNHPTAENTTTTPVRKDSNNPSKMAIGQERDATNHPGGESMDGEIARLLIYDTAHSDTEFATTLAVLIKTYHIETKSAEN